MADARRRQIKPQPKKPAVKPSVKKPPFFNREWLVLWRALHWPFLLAGTIYLSLALYGYHHDDWAWSHSGSGAEGNPILNPMGTLGAYLSDILFYLFGISAWWWPLLLLQQIWMGYRKLRTVNNVQRPNWLVFISFLILIVASSTFEALRLYSLSTPLPLEPGGMFGLMLSDHLTDWFGFTGATVLLLAVMVGSMSVFLGFSWLNLFEWLGSKLDWCYVRIKQEQEIREDKRIGEQAKQQRDSALQQKRGGASAEADAAATPVEQLNLPIDVVAPTVKDQAASIIKSSFDKLRFGNKKGFSSSPENTPTKKMARTEPVSTSTPPEEISLAKTAARGSDVEETSFFEPVFRLFSGSENLPPLDLLDPPGQMVESISAEVLEHTSRLIVEKLQEFGVTVEVVGRYPGPVITRYEIQPEAGVKGSKIMGLSKDLARALSLISIRIVETIPGKTCMALELPNPRRQIVHLQEILGSSVYTQSASPLTMAMGKDIGGNTVVADLAKMPHVLVAGTTGSGKSVAINAMILSLLYKATPQQVRLLLVDPKMLELSVYEDIPHLIAPVVTDMRQAASALNWCVVEMDKRYRLMSALGVRNLAGYNQKVREAIESGQPFTNPFTLTPDNPEPLEEIPLLVVFIDELADLMMVVGKKIEELIARLAQKARASGIHLVLATQRPSVDVITGLIKANVPTRVAFQVSSKIDSRTILDQMGAEALLGQGDMLYLPPGTGYPQRVHGAFVSDAEVHRVVEYIKAQGAPQYIDGVLNSLDSADDQASGEVSELSGEKDPMYDKAVDVVLESRRASISYVQRELRIGYNRAARLIEQMEAAGIVSSMQNNGNREVIVPKREG